MLHIQRILCPTDFSEPSYEGLRAARELANHYTAELILLHVVKPIPAYWGGEAPSVFHIPAVLKDMEKKAAEMLEELIASYSKNSTITRPLVIHGKPADEIVRTAAEEKADMIVIATHGESGWQRFISGSVAEKVVKISPCPVLSIPSANEN